jgi:hypothetical protein
MQTVVEGGMLTFECAQGEGISTGAFGILNEDVMMIWEVCQGLFFCHALRSRE